MVNGTSHDLNMDVVTPTQSGAAIKTDPAALPLFSALPRAVNARLGLYRQLSKSGIVTLVLISVLGGYLIGHPFEAAFSLKRLTETLGGVLFLASGSSALNQFQERKIDATMPRTAKRPMPSGRLSSQEVLVFIGVCLLVGLVTLAVVSSAVFVLGVLAIIFYNGFYTLWWKKHWAYAAIPGAIPGALPALMGHVAANGHLWNPGGIYLFSLIFFWQMPHFWVLALRFRKDYELGHFPTLPVALGESITVLQIALWCLAYIGLALLGPLFFKTGSLYPSIVLPMCAILLWKLTAFVRAPAKSSGKAWLSFFLWVNFSLIVFVGAAVLDLWSWGWGWPKLH